jgi:hypothetical protein
MGNQQTFASLAWSGKGKVTRRARFLAERDAVIPWSWLVKLIEPHYRKAGQGRQPRDWSSCCGFTSCSNGSSGRTPGRRGDLGERVAAAVRAGGAG